MKRVLVALDRSERAPHVLETAALIVEKFGAELHLLRVIDVPPDIPPAAHLSHADNLESAMTTAAESELELLRAGAHVGASLHIVSDPSPPHAILRAAEELDVDLIVVGSHGYHGWDRLLGTNAAAVANRAKRDVLVVHARSPGR